MRSRIEPMKKFARTLRNHRELLLNYFLARKAFSSGVIEGLNNKAKPSSCINSVVWWPKRASIKGFNEF